MFYGAQPYLFHYAKELRNNPTRAEQLLWEKLKNKKLGVKFRNNILFQTTLSTFTAIS